MYSKQIKDKAIKLRKEGNSYYLISSSLKISKSVLSLWLKDIEYIPNEITNQRIASNVDKVVKIRRIDKVLSINKSKDFARKEIGNFDSRDIFIFGLGIYLGEGSKTSNFTRIVNADPRIIKFSMIWLKKSFGLSDKNFRIRLHLYPDSDVQQVTSFWVNYLKLDKDKFHTPYIDKRLNKKKNRVGLLPYGTAHLSVVSNGDKNLGVLLQRKILASIDFALDQFARLV